MSQIVGSLRAIGVAPKFATRPPERRRYDTVRVAQCAVTARARSCVIGLRDRVPRMNNWMIVRVYLAFFLFSSVWVPCSDCLCPGSQLHQNIGGTWPNGVRRPTGRSTAGKTAQLSGIGPRAYVHGEEKGVRSVTVLLTPRHARRPPNLWFRKKTIVIGDDRIVSGLRNRS
jgi:hypothetical protein